MSLVLLCPGQGSQSAEMFACVTGHAGAEVVLSAAEAVLSAPPRTLAADGISPFLNRIAQPLVCAATLARWEAVRDSLPEPGLVLGYSVGELAAHAIAGSFSAAECLRLAAQRAEAMDAVSPPDAGLLAVRGLCEARVQALCAAHGAAIAIVNGPTHCVLGGPAAALAALETAIGATDAKLTRLPITVPSHTPWLAAAVAAFADSLQASALQAPSLPVLAGIDGSRVFRREDVIRTLAAQLAQTVRWQDCLIQAVERGGRAFLELGPGCALARIARESFPDLPIRALDEFAHVAGACAWVQRVLGDS